MKLIFVLIVLFTRCEAHSQFSFLGQARSEIENKLRAEEDSLITQSDSTLSYSLPGDFQGLITATCHFSKEDKCALISFTSKDSKAYRDYLTGILKLRKYRWRKINGNQYVSRYKKKLLLETDPDSSKRSFRIIPAQWTRETYRTFTLE